MIDRTYQRFDHLRSLLVLAFASEEFLQAHCLLAYDAADSFKANSARFRRGLFQWEKQTIGRFFPAPPARVLLGGAGGGREAFALVEMGYRVLAFDPAPGLAASMRDKGETDYPDQLEAYCGGYEDLPIMHEATGAAIDLRSQPSFDAAILGWGSFSHLTQDAARVAALEAVRSLTGGPILVSYWADPAHNPQPPSGGGIMNALRRRARRRGSSMFTTGIGYARYLSEAELRQLVSEAGLEIVHVDVEAGWPHAILRAQA